MSAKDLNYLHEHILRERFYHLTTGLKQHSDACQFLQQLVAIQESRRSQNQARIMPFTASTSVFNPKVQPIVW